LPQPGPASAGGHWVYRHEGHRKCWFEAAEEGAVARKPARHHVARHSVAAAEENESAPRKQKDVEDARAELLSSAPAETPQPAPSEPTPKMVHTVPVRTTDAAGQVPPAPVLNKPAADQPTTPDQPHSDQSGPRQLDAETLLAKAPPASEQVASAPPATPIADPGATTGGGEEGTASWFGVLLMALGAAALLSSSRTLRRALWPVRFQDSRTERPVIAHGGRDDPAFVRRASDSPASGETSFSAATRSFGPHTARARRTVAPGSPSQEAF
jgi:hypothetical protein